MSDSLSSVPETVPATDRTPTNPSRWLIWLAVGGVVLAVMALVWALTLSQRIGKTQQEMARRTADTLAEVAAARHAATQAESVAKELAARLGVAELRLSEVSLQRSQLEELMLSVSRSRDDSLVQDIESALRLAIQQSQLTGSAQPLISALLGADQRIERSAQPRLNPVQRAIARDVERLRAAELVDVPALVNRIDEMLRQVDDWPLRNAPLSVRLSQMPAVESAQVTELVPPPSAEPASEPEPDPTETPEASERSLAERQWARFNEWRARVTERWWHQFIAATADLIRVSRIDQPEAALLAPEQSYLLRENIKMKLLSARLALLGRQLDTARADILATRDLVQRFFDDSSPSVRMALQGLSQLHANIRQESVPHPDETLGALAVAASGR